MSTTIDVSKIEHIADIDSILTVVAEECPGVNHENVEFPSKFSLLDTTNASMMGSGMF
ncbi:hypothetical protein J3B01_004987 [Coemansia erecta]|nr:hypothetical protein J3B01_004987 [Coemansia erecta]